MERRLVVSSPLAFVDAGANGTYTISLTTVPITLGGTGAITQPLAAINILPTAVTKGTILVWNGSNWVVKGPGTDGFLLEADSATADGLDWVSIGSLGPATGTYIVATDQDATLPNSRLLTDGTGIDVADGGAAGNFVVSIDATVATLAGIQTFTNKVYTTPVVTSPLTFDFGANDIILTATNPVASRTFNFPDIADGDVVITAGAQTITGAKTYTTSPIITPATISIGGFNQTFPGAADTIVNLGSAQLLSLKTLASPIIQTQLDFDTAGAGNFQLTFESLTGNRAITVEDPNAVAKLVFVAGAPAQFGAMYYDGDAMQSTAQGSLGKPLVGQGASAPIFATFLGQDAGGTAQTTWTAGDLLTVNDAGLLVKLPQGTNGQVLTVDTTLDPNLKWSTGGGAVTSVGLAIPGFPVTISGSPVTTSGTLTATPAGVIGDILFFDSTTSIARRAIATSPGILWSNSATSSNPQWATSSTLFQSFRSNKANTSIEAYSDNQDIVDYKMASVQSMVDAFLTIGGGNSGTSINPVGTRSAIRDSTGSYVQTNSSVAHPLPHSTAIIDFAGVAQPPKWVATFVFKMGAAADFNSTTRTYIGLASADIDSVYTGKDAALFRYEPLSGVDGTVFWRCVTNDGGATPTVTTTAVAVSADTRYEFRIDATDPTSIKFWIDGALVATHTTDLPTASLIIYPLFSTEQTTAASTNILFSKLIMEYE
jgi:hypothetical protein